MWPADPLPHPPPRSLGTHPSLTTAAVAFLLLLLAAPTSPVSCAGLGTHPSLTTAAGVAFLLLLLAAPTSPVSPDDALVLRPLACLSSGYCSVGQVQPWSGDVAKGRGGATDQNRRAAVQTCNDQLRKSARGSFKEPSKLAGRLVA